MSLFTNALSGASSGALWSFIGYRASAATEGFRFNKFLGTVVAGAITGGVVGFVAGANIEDNKDFIVFASGTGFVTAAFLKVAGVINKWRLDRKKPKKKKK